MTYADAIRRINEKQRKSGYKEHSLDYWRTTRVSGNYIWTLDHSNLFNVVRWRSREDDDD